MDFNQVHRKRELIGTTALDDNFRTMKPTPKANAVVPKEYLYYMQVP